MIMDLTHNKVVMSTLTDNFKACFERDLCPKLSCIFGSDLLGVQMYEDYISDDLSEDGFWHYPLTVIRESGPEVLWIRWSLEPQSLFEGSMPYAYLGDSLEFDICDTVPQRLAAKIRGRAHYAEGNVVKLSTHTASNDKTFLSGKYSQTFIDEMARQLDVAISREMNVAGLSESTVQISLPFAPDTYMEHTSECVTYRRLLLVSKGCTPRDFWVKWTRLDGLGGFSVRDHVDGADIRFELGEDVPHKIREKEYRFLVYGNSDKYRVAMGRKNLVEWREIIKRAVKRGELEYTEREIPAPGQDDELMTILARCAGTDTAPSAAAEYVAPKESSAFEEAMRIAMSRAGAEVLPEDSDEAALTEDILDVPEEMPSEEDGLSFVESLTEEEEAEEPEKTEEPDVAPWEIMTEDGESEEEPEEYEEEESEEYEEEPEEYEEESEESEDSDGTDDDFIPLTARWAEREKDAESQRRAEEASKLLDSREEALRQREEALRLRMEELMRLEEEERQRRAREQAVYEEAVRIAKQESDRRMEEIEAREAKAREEEARINALRLEAEARIRAEEERSLRAEPTQVSREEAVAKAQMLRQMIEESSRQMAEEQIPVQPRAEEEPSPITDPIPEPEPVTPTPPAADAPTHEEKASSSRYNYTSKVVRLIFRYNVDPNVLSKIHGVIESALEYYSKTHVYIKIKASILDNFTVILNFVRIPEEELELLKNIIRYIGNSNLGITRAILE